WIATGGAARIWRRGALVGLYAMWPDGMSSHRRAGWSRMRPTPSSVVGDRSITGGAMVEVPEVAFPRSRGAYRAAPRVVRPRSRSGDPDLATRKRIRSRPLGLSEARGAGNRARIGLASELRCECTRPNCTEMLPGVAGTHRR